MNSLIYGADDTQNIVNLTLKNNTLFLYTETNEGVKEEQYPFQPWVLSHDQVKDHSIRLKGDQYWKYLTFTSCDKFNTLQQSFQRDLWLPRSIEECVTLYDGVTFFKGMKVADVSILSFDIETSGLVMDETSKVFLISNTLRNKEGTYKKLFSIEDYADQNDLIANWCYWVKESDPSIMCGHNIMSYDLPYLRHCYQDNLDLGRDNSDAEFSEKESKVRKDGSQSYSYYNIRITGREIVDTFFLSMKYDIAREFGSYGLKPIIKQLGLEKSDRSFVDASKIREYYERRKEKPEDWTRVKAYASEDSDDALKLFDLMIPASFYLCQSVPMSLQEIVNKATGTYINNFMIRSYLQDGHSIAATTKIKDHLEGGISFGVPGLYKNLFKADLRAAYPSQILRFKLFDSKKDPKGYFYEMVKHYTYERFDLKDMHKKTGDKYYKDREQASKIVINSAYGTLSTNYLNYNSPGLAAKITYETREVIDLALKWASSKDKNYWIALFKEKTGA